jgi:mono/diheme cytochrome c family protein
MPKPFTSVVFVLTLLMMIPVALLVKQRVVKSENTRAMLVFDMDNQDKVKTQKANEAFADGRAMRLQPEGTVARDEIVDDPHLTEGKVDGEWATSFPVPVDEDLLARGRERYDIYCAMCHGHSGEGDGMINQRANSLMEGTWVPPTNLVSDAVVDRPVGHIYNTIRRGIRNMPPYAAQVPVDDRWAIVAYVRALQLSRGAASVSDLSPDDGAALTAAAR